MPPPDSHDKPVPLERLLDDWRHDVPSAPGSVTSEVWRRIAARDRSANSTDPQDLSPWARLHVAFARPSFAAAFVAACVLLGLFLAEARSSRLQAAYGAQLAQSYVRLIDPLLSEPVPVKEAKP